MAGVPFKRLLGLYPDARLAVESAFGADLAAADPGTWTWTDVTTDVMYVGGPTSISPMGRGDETAKPQPAGCNLALLNTSGKYSKGLPSSPYWPYVRRNTPVRVSVQRAASPTFRSIATTTSAVSSFAATAPAGVAAGDVVLAFHSADASYLGDLKTPSGAPWRLLAEVANTSLPNGGGFGYLATRVWYYRATGAAPGSYTFTQGGVANGVVSIVAIQNAGLYTVKATTRANTAPGNDVITPSSSPLRTDDFELRWAGASSLAGAAGVTWTPPAGLTERADAQSGNYTSATLATRTVGATTATGTKTFTASAPSTLDWGHGVTVNFSNVNVRFFGYANGFVPSWDTSAKVATVNASMSGIRRRLGQGKTPLKSALNRASVAANPFAYWPLEDGPNSTQAASGLVGGAPMTLLRPTGTVTNPVPANSPLAEFAKTEGTAGSDKVVYLGDSYLFAPLAGTNTTAWRFDWIGRYDQFSTGIFTTEMLRVYADNSPNHKQWRVAADNVDVYVYFFSEPTGEVVITSTGHQIYDGKTHHFGLVVDQNGANIDAHLYMDGQQIGLGSYLNKTLTAVTGVQAGSADNYLETAAPKPSVGHIAFWDMDPPGVVLYPAAIGYVGEIATARLARLGAEEKVPIEIIGTSDTTMGPQSVDTFLNLVDECATTDDGVLYDGRGPGMTYVARTVRYNAAAALTADMAADPPQVGAPFSPADDDQRDRNLVTVTRKGGSSATYEDDFSPLGTQAIGVYDSKVSPDPNYSDDSVNYFRAAHEVKKGTVDAPYRYPRLNLDLGAVPAIVEDWLTAGVSSRINATNVATKTTQHPPGDIDLLLEGWAEQLSPLVWSVAGNCSPFEPWRVGVIEGAGDTTWRIDSGSSTLAASAIAGATTLSVASSDSAELWSTVAGDHPRAVDVGGVRVTVTAVSGAVSPQTFTVDSLPYPLTAGAVVKLWRPPKIAL